MPHDDEETSVNPWAAAGLSLIPIVGPFILGRMRQDAQRNYNEKLGAAALRPIFNIAGRRGLNAADACSSSTRIGDELLDPLTPQGLADQRTLQRGDSMKRYGAALALFFVVLASSPAWAAVSCALVTSSNDSSATPGTAFTTGSHTITGGNLALFFMSSAKSTAGADNGDPTVTTTHTGVTWTKITSVQLDDPARSLHVYRVLPGSNTTGTITATYGATQDRAEWNVVQCSGIDTSGTNGSGAIVQSATNSTLSATSLAVTLSAYGNANNRPVAAFRVSDNVTIVEEWTQLSEDSSGAGSTMSSQWKNATDDTTPSMSYTGPARVIIGVAVEVKAAGTGGAGCIIGGGLLRAGCL
jgi:hypothetical protein